MLVLVLLLSIGFQLVIVAVAWEDRDTQEQLHGNATQGPHVNGTGVRNTQDDFRTTVKTTLNVRVHSLVFMTATAKVNDLDLWAIQATKEDVLWFQVTMDDSGLFEQAQGIQYLGQELMDQAMAEALVLVLFEQFIQVDGQQLKDNAQVATEYEGVLHASDMSQVLRVMSLVE